MRGYLTWLAAADVGGDPLTQARARDWAVRDYRTHLVTVAKCAPRTVNTAHAAIDDFYTRPGLGPAAASRLDLPAQAPRALDAKTALPSPTCSATPASTPSAPTPTPPAADLTKALTLLPQDR